MGEKVREKLYILLLVPSRQAGISYYRPPIPCVNDSIVYSVSFIMHVCA